ncbi:MAG: dihydropyrimidinase [Candidatus Brocadiae bacterium]|nr:dihydropyrimidinase [Candidatus Brocadiia bacterium]
MELILKNGRIVTASDTYKADIGIRNGKIVTIAQEIPCLEKSTVIDAKNNYIFPGIIDAHVHCQLPMAGTISSDDFINATKAGACGGVTTIIDFSTQMPGKSLVDSILQRKEEARGKVCIDYSLHAGITDWGLAQNEIDRAFQEGVSSFKMFMTYRQRGLMSDDAQIYHALEETKKRGGIITVHAESTPLLDFLVKRYHEQKEQYGAYAHVLSRPDMIEVDAIERAVRLAELSKGRLYVVHTSTGRGAMAIREARFRGVQVYCETCPQYLLLDESVFQRQDGHLYASCPQVKSKKNQEELWHLIQTGDIHVIATDHCTFTKEQKDLWKGDFTCIPFGLPGIETMLSTTYTKAVHSGLISPSRMVALLSTNPAKIFGLYPQKGTIAIGSDADLVVFDPHKKSVLDYKNLQTNCNWSPYQGMEITGSTAITISKGKILAMDGKFIGEAGQGDFVFRTACQTI